MRKRFLVQFTLEVDPAHHRISNEVDDAVDVLNMVTERISWSMEDDDELHDVRVVRLIDTAPILDAAIRGRVR